MLKLDESRLRTWEWRVKYSILEETDSRDFEQILTILTPVLIIKINLRIYFLWKLINHNVGRCTDQNLRFYLELWIKIEKNSYFFFPHILDQMIYNTGTGNSFSSAWWALNQTKGTSQGLLHSLYLVKIQFWQIGCWKSFRHFNLNFGRVMIES